MVIAAEHRVLGGRRVCRGEEIPLPNIVLDLAHCFARRVCGARVDDNAATLKISGGTYPTNSRG